MASGRRNRGSRHRSHKQHHKQKLEDFADSDSEPNLRHGPLLESDSCSAWPMEPPRPHVEGPSAVTQDIVDNWEFNRESSEDSLSGSATYNKRRREVLSRVDATVSSPSSLDRWDGGQSHVDDSLPMLDFARSASQEVQHEFLTNECKCYDEGKIRKGKCHGIPDTHTLANQQVDSNVAASVNYKPNRHRDLSEFLNSEVSRSCIVDGDESAIQSTKGLTMGFGAEGDGSRKIYLKRWDNHKDSDIEFRPLQPASFDVSVIEPEHKREESNEALWKTKKSEDVARETDQQNTFVSVEKGINSAYWAVQNNRRNIELEKELEKRSRHRREESGEREKGKETRWPYYKEGNHNKAEGVPFEDEGHCEKLQGELFVEKEKDTEKYTDKKVKVERVIMKLKDGQDHEKKSNLHRENEEIGFAKNSKNERHRDGKHWDSDRDDKIMQTQDPKLKESKLSENRSHGKGKEGIIKEEKGEDTIFRVKMPIEDREQVKEKGCGDMFSQGRAGNNKEKRKERGDKYERYRNEKLKMEKERVNKQRAEMDRDYGGEIKGGYGSRKGEKEHTGVHKQREELGRELKDDKHRGNRDGEYRQRNSNIKLQACKDQEGKYKDEAVKSKKQGLYEYHKKWQDDENKHERLNDGWEVRIGMPKVKVYDHTVHDERKRSCNDAGDLQRILRGKEDWGGDEEAKDEGRCKGLEKASVRIAAIGKSLDEVPSGKLVCSDYNIARGKVSEDLSGTGEKGLGRDVVGERILKVAKQVHIRHQVFTKDSMDEKVSFQPAAVLANEMEGLEKAITTVDVTSVERDHERPGNKVAEGKEDWRSSYQNQEQEVCLYEVLARSPPPVHFSTHEKTSRRAEASMSSSSGTRRSREKCCRMSEHLDLTAQQQHSLDEEVRSWEPHLRSQEDRRGRSWTPDRYHDYQNSPSPRGSCAKGHDEPLRGRMRDLTPYQDGSVHELDHRRFTQGGSTTKLRRLDEPSCDRGEPTYQGASNWLTADRPLPPNRAMGPSGLLPPPPPFRPGIDNPAVLGSSAHSFEQGLNIRDGGRYGRKSGGPIWRSEIAGLGDTWRGVHMGNWQGHGPVPGGMFPPYGSGGFYGLEQQLPVPHFFGRNGMRPSAEMGFSGARFHMSDGFSGHAPNPSSVVGWHKPVEGENSSFPLLEGPLDAWEGQGLYVDRRQRFEWDQDHQGFPGRGFHDPWQDQEMTDGFGCNTSPQLMSREGINKVKTEETYHQDVETSEVAKDRAAASTLGESKLGSSIHVRTRQALLQSIDVSVKLAGINLYKQYLDMLPSPEAKKREPLLIHTRSSSHYFDEDLQFEADPEALELLAANHQTELLSFFEDGRFKEALKVYNKPAQQNRIQKSLFGSFILPVGLSTTKKAGGEIVPYKVIDEDLGNSISREGLVGEGTLVQKGTDEDLVMQCTNEVRHDDPTGLLHMVEMVDSSSQQVDRCGEEYADQHLPSSSPCDQRHSCEYGRMLRVIGRENSDSNQPQPIASEDCARSCMADDDGNMSVLAPPVISMELPEAASFDALVDSKMVGSDPEGKSRPERSPEKACENTH